MTTHNSDVRTAAAKRAFGIYEAEGYAGGRELEHWFQSETEILGAGDQGRMKQNDCPLLVRFSISADSDIIASVSPQSVLIQPKDPRENY